MDLADYRNSLVQIRKKHPHISWKTCRLRPNIDPLGEMDGWSLVWAGTFEDANFVRLRENWKGPGPNFARGFFSYHYGPYRPEWDLESVRCKVVIVRVDGIDYFGRGYHIHDGAKDVRIFQDSLKAPSLADIDIPGFLKAVAVLRAGRTVSEAFELEPL